MIVNYICDNKIHMTYLNDLSTLHREGKISGHTVVYNPLVQNKKDLEENFKTTLERSWLKNLI
jgi:hypothetical protein